MCLNLDGVVGLWRVVKVKLDDTSCFIELTCDVLALGLLGQKFLSLVIVTFFPIED